MKSPPIKEDEEKELAYLLKFATPYLYTYPGHGVEEHDLHIKATKLEQRGLLTKMYQENDHVLWRKT